MTRDTIPVTSTVLAGVAATLLAPPVFANQAEVANPDGHTVVVYVNGLGAAGGSDTEVSINQVACPHGRIEDDAAFDVTSGVVGVFGPFPPLLYNQSDGTVQFDFEDAITGDEAIFAINVL